MCGAAHWKNDLAVEEYLNEQNVFQLFYFIKKMEKVLNLCVSKYYNPNLISDLTKSFKNLNYG